MILFLYPQNVIKRASLTAPSIRQAGYHCGRYYHATEGRWTLGNSFSLRFVRTGSDSVTLIAIIIFPYGHRRHLQCARPRGNADVNAVEIVDRFRRKNKLTCTWSLSSYVLGAAVGRLRKRTNCAIVIALAFTLGWDVPTGMGMSILPSAAEFPAASQPFHSG